MPIAAFFFALHSSLGHVQARTAGNVTVARLMASDREPEEWLSGGRDWRGTYFSPLRQINTTTVKRLGFAWSYDTGTNRGLEATPIVVDGVMYTSGNWGRVYALDARTGRELWTFVPKVDGQYGRYACCDVVNRGVAVWQGKVFVAALDGWLYALDAATGKVEWKVDSFADRKHPTTITGAPQIAGDVVVIGEGGADFADCRGYVSAFDIRTGRLRWRFYTVPRDPRLAQESPELAAASKTWARNSLWRSGGGGTPWDGMAYDPQLDLLYVGTGNASPYSWADRSPGGGANLFLASILAIHPKTGRLAWYYQEVPGERWDYTATQKMILADLTINGRLRHVLMQAPKDGFFYVLDRKTGQLISANPYVPINWAKRIDLGSGRPIFTGQAEYERHPALVLPAASGGHNWQPMAFNPQTGLVYIPTIEASMIYAKGYDLKAHDLADRWNVNGIFPEDYPKSGIPELGLPPLGKALRGITPPGRRGVLKAWDPIAGRAVWQAVSSDYWQGGVMTTAGGLVFQGGVDGRLIVRSAADGSVLKAIQTGSSIMAAPMTYKIAGIQYVAVMAGFGGAAGWVFPENSAARKFGNEGRILVFRLDGGAMPLPPLATSAPFPKPPAKFGKISDIKEGERLFGEQCARCHADVEHGLVPDLRRMDMQTHRVFNAIVLHGLLLDGGMGRFDDILTPAQADQIHEYLIDESWKAYGRPDKTERRTLPPKAN